MKKKVTYIISNLNKAIAFEWIAMELNKDKYELSFILLNPGTSALENEMLGFGINVKSIMYRGKRDMPSAFLKIYFYLLIKRPDIIHAHLFDACLLSLPAAFFAGIKRRIHTRHSSVFHHEEHSKMVKYDKIINSFSTQIVSISPNVSDVLINMENLSRGKVILIPHGFILEGFCNVDEGRIKTLKAKYQTIGRYPVIGVISRYIGWKGIQYIIPAFEKLLESYPDSLLIIANANGDFHIDVHKLLENIPPDNFLEIEFEEDLFALYKLFDVFVHVPISSKAEAFGQIYVEALAASIPSIFTLSGIANEFIKDHQNALVADYKNSDAIYRCLIELISKTELRQTIIINGKNDVFARYQLENMIESLEELYG